MDYNVAHALGVAICQTEPEFIYDKYTCHLFNDINWSVNLDSIYDLIAADQMIRTSMDRKLKKERKSEREKWKKKSTVIE